MNGDQMPYDNWNVRECYFGKFESDTSICACTELDAAIDIVNAMLVFKKGRPFSYHVIYTGNRPSYVPTLIEEYNKMVYEMTGYEIDHSEYLKPKYCL